jgi:hypothetical protein
VGLISLGTSAQPPIIDERCNGGIIVGKGSQKSNFPYWAPVHYKSLMDFLGIEPGAPR